MSSSNARRLAVPSSTAAAVAHSQQMVEREEIKERENRFSSLLAPVRDLAQNWNIDVARDLEDYLEELEHLEISFDGGITSLNFAEAARLIQGSACVYSRKVEYLYSLIYQALELLSAQSKNAKNKKGGAAGGLSGADADAAALEEEARDEFLLLDDVVTEGRNIDLAERADDLALTLEMTMGYVGGSGATPTQRKQAAAVLAKTPLSVMAACRFDRRDDRGSDFLLQSCAVSRVSWQTASAGLTAVFDEVFQSSILSRLS